MFGWTEFIFILSVGFFKFLRETITLYTTIKSCEIFIFFCVDGRPFILKKKIWPDPRSIEANTHSFMQAAILLRLIELDHMITVHQATP